jgi:hypothetical protein
MKTFIFSCIIIFLIILGFTGGVIAQGIKRTPLTSPATRQSTSFQWYWVTVNGESRWSLGQRQQDGGLILWFPGN